MDTINSMIRTFGNFFWIIATIVYYIVWRILDEIGVIYLFAAVFVKPLLPNATTDYAYNSTNIILVLIMFGLGSSFFRK